MSKKGKAKPSLEFVPTPSLIHPMTDDFRKQLIELLRQDSWAINRIIEILMEKRLENRDRIERIEKELREADSDG